MIVVSGTGRSGTSMWMQALAASGLPVIGEAFPLDWERFSLANPRGYFESMLLGGIHSRSNPHPSSGIWLDPEQTRDVAVKIFLHGLPLSQHAFLDAVIVSVRHWRAYAGSVRRTTAIFGHDPNAGRDPLLKWWFEHWDALQDALLRGYRCRFVSYESVLARPEVLLPEILDWAGVSCDTAAAVGAVEPTLCTQSTATPVPGVSAEWAETFDAFYDHIHEGRAFGSAFVAEMSAFHQRLLAELPEGRVALDRWAQRAPR